MRMGFARGRKIGAGLMKAITQTAQYDYSRIVYY